jgi:starvation-inducible DNA-binding protein
MGMCHNTQVKERESSAFAMTDMIAERARKIGCATLRSISEMARYQRLQDDNDASIAPMNILSELCADNQQRTRFLCATHAVCDEHQDVATASLIENWIDETEQRTWFLAEITRNLSIADAAFTVGHTGSAILQ